MAELQIRHGWIFDVPDGLDWIVYGARVLDPGSKKMGFVWQYCSLNGEFLIQDFHRRVLRVLRRTDRGWEVIHEKIGDGR